MIVSGRDVLIYLSLKFNGNRNAMLAACKMHEMCDLEEVARRVKEVRCKVTTFFDPDFPLCMKSGICPPLVLYYSGNLDLIKNINRSVAIVGSRECSEYALTYTRLIAKELAEEGYTIISGLARGVDTAALEAALPYGKAVAVLGNGFRQYYPSENWRLQQSIGESGLLLSEYPPYVPPSAMQFPVRNRLIAAAGNITLITSAKAHSGTLITAGFALESGRGIGCLPERAGEESVCNALIKEGAALVENAHDAIDLINPHLDTVIERNFLKGHYK